MIRRIGVPVTSSGPADYNAWWNMPGARDAAQAYPVVLDPAVTWIALDPGTTTPNVVITVDVPGAGRMLLTPGGVVPVPRNSHPIHMWNTAAAVWKGTYTSNPQGNAKVTALYGRVGLVTGDDASLPVWLAYANRVTGAAPKAQAIYKGALPSAEWVRFPTTNLRGIRVSALPGDANGAPVALPTAPAAFTTTLRQITSPISWGTGAVFSGGDVLDVPAVLPASLYPPEALTAADLVLATGTLTYGQYADVAITVPSFMHGLYVVSIAGTGVTTAIVCVEGY